MIWGRTVVVAIHQPMYLPWLGYFDKLLSCDLFVLLDSVQFPDGKDFCNRNLVKTANGPVMLTVPIQRTGHRAGTIRTTRVANEHPWQRKHLGTFRQGYAHAPCFRDLMPELEQLYAVEHRTIGALNEAHLRFWLDWFEIRRRLIRSSDLRVDGAKAGLILDICVQLGASTYLSGALGRDYLDEPAFESAGIGLIYQDFTHPTYGQLHGDFVPRMGVVDYAMMGGMF